MGPRDTSIAKPCEALTLCREGEMVKCETTGTYSGWLSSSLPSVRSITFQHILRFL